MESVTIHEEERVPLGRDGIMRQGDWLCHDEESSLKTSAFEGSSRTLFVVPLSVMLHSETGCWKMRHKIQEATANHVLVKYYLILPPMYGVA